LVDEDSGLEVISFSKEVVKGIGKLRRKDYCFPFGMVSSGVKMGHGIVEAFAEVGVR